MMSARKRYILDERLEERLDAAENAHANGLEHEVRTILTDISFAAEFIKDSTARGIIDPNEHANLANMILAKCQSLVKITTNFREEIYDQSGNKPVKASSVHGVMRAVNLSKYRYQLQGVNLIYNNSVPTDTMIRGTPGQIHEIATYMAGGACEFQMMANPDAPERRVFIDVTEDANNVFIAVRAMPLVTKDQINKYYRNLADNKTLGSDRTNIGYPLAHAIIADLGGSIDPVCEGDDKLSFVCRLPKRDLSAV